MKRSRMFGMAAVLAAGFATATAAKAAPFGYGPPDGGVRFERVAGGCGPGFHPNPWGVCRPNWGPRPYWGAGPYYRRPVGWGAYGRPYPPPYRPYGFYGPRW